jgi:hypothetical protein
VNVCLCMVRACSHALAAIVLVVCVRCLLRRSPHHLLPLRLACAHHVFVRCVLASASLATVLSDFCPRRSARPRLIARATVITSRACLHAVPCADAWGDMSRDGLAACASLADSCACIGMLMRREHVEAFALCIAACLRVHVHFCGLLLIANMKNSIHHSYASMSDSEEEQFQAADSGASDRFPQQCSALRKNGFVVMKDRPCKIVDMSTSKVPRS